MLRARHDYRYRWDPGCRVAEDGLSEKLGKEDAEALVSLTCEALGVSEPEVRWDLCASFMGQYVPGGGRDLRQRTWHRNRPVIRFWYGGGVSQGTVLHEVAHHIHACREPEDALHDGHGPGFLRHFRKVLSLWTEVPELPAYKTTRFTRKLAQELVARYYGKGMQVMQVRRTGDDRMVLCNDGRWRIFCRMYASGREEWVPLHVKHARHGGAGEEQSAEAEEKGNAGA